MVKTFCEFLNGAEIKEREEPGRKDETIKEGGKEDRRDDMEFIEDVGRAIERLKNKKAPGIDGIPMEAWRCCNKKRINRVIKTNLE